MPSADSLWSASHSPTVDANPWGVIGSGPQQIQQPLQVLAHQPHLQFEDALLATVIAGSPTDLGPSLAGKGSPGAVGDGRPPLRLARLHQNSPIDKVRQDS